MRGGMAVMLTGQVFAIMSGTAEDSQIEKITRSADHYLYQKEIGGYRLNNQLAAPVRYWYIPRPSERKYSGIPG